MITQEQVTSDFNELALIYKEYNPKISTLSNHYSEFRVKLDESLELWIYPRIYPSEYRIGANGYFQVGNYSGRETLLAINSKAKGTRLITKISQLIPEIKQKAQEFIAQQQQFLDELNAFNARKQRIMNAIPELEDCSRLYSNSNYSLESGTYQSGTKVTLDTSHHCVDVKLMGLTEEQAILILEYFHSQYNVK